MGEIRKKRSTTKQLHLPPEIIEDILLRIPAEYLLPLKAVCKQWFHIISSHKFVDTHLAHHGGDFVQILVSKKPGNYRNEYDIIKLRDMRGCRFELHQKQLEELISDELDLQYSCNGLLLFRSQNLQRKRQLYVCNPATRKCATLSLPKLQNCISDWVLVHDASFQKYKVVGIPYGSGACYLLTLDTHNHNEEVDH